MAAKKRIIHPIQLDSELDAKITHAAKKLSLPKAEVMRLAMAIGLEHFRRINFDLAAYVCQTPEPFHEGKESFRSTLADGANSQGPPLQRRKKQG
jgi:DNA-binding MurR/RpiR family transcriptional regulator